MFYKANVLIAYQLLMEYNCMGQGFYFILPCTPSVYSSAWHIADSDGWLDDGWKEQQDPKITK